MKMEHGEEPSEIESEHSEINDEHHACPFLVCCLPLIPLCKTTFENVQENLFQHQIYLAFMMKTMKRMKMPGFI